MQYVLTRVKSHRKGISLEEEYGEERTREIKAKMSEARKGSIPWNKGKTNVYSKETLEKMSKARSGRIPWNKGNHIRLGTGGFKKGHIPWNKGKLNVYTEETRATMRRMAEERWRDDAYRKMMCNALKGRAGGWNKNLPSERQPFFGKHHSEETKQKIRRANKGHIPWMKGRHHSIETRRKMSGRPRSLKIRRQISNSMLKRWRDPDFRRKMSTQLHQAGHMIETHAELMSERWLEDAGRIGLDATSLAWYREHPELRVPINELMVVHNQCSSFIEYGPNRPRKSKLYKRDKP